MLFTLVVRKIDYQGIFKPRLKQENPSPRRPVATCEGRTWNLIYDIFKRHFRDHSSDLRFRSFQLRITSEWNPLRNDSKLRNRAFEL